MMKIKEPISISKEQKNKFEEYMSKIGKGDKVFDSAKKASEFLKKRVKKK